MEAYYFHESATAQQRSENVLSWLCCLMITKNDNLVEQQRNMERDVGTVPRRNNGEPPTISPP
jgi:hypothetical protein